MQLDLSKPQPLDLSKFSDRCDPFRDTVWFEVGEAPITREEVRAAIAEGRLRKEPCPTFSYGFGPKEDEVTRKDHIERVAYLVVHRWPDPVQVDFGVPALGCHVDWPMIDGNHRLAAALYQELLSIDASFSGDESEIENWILETQ